MGKITNDYIERGERCPYSLHIIPVVNNVICPFSPLLCEDICHWVKESAKGRRRGRDITCPHCGIKMKYKYYGDMYCEKREKYD